jgi:hypothetical protein
MYTVAGFLIAIIIVIAGFFLLEIEKIALNYWAFAFLLFSLVVSMFTNVSIAQTKRNKDGVFYNAGLSVAVWLYQIAIIVTMFFVKSFGDGVGKLALLEIVINALFFITVIALVGFARHIHDKNAETLAKRENGEFNTPKRGGF